MHDRAGQAGRTGCLQAEKALPGWACLGRIRAVGGIEGTRFFVGERRRVRNFLDTPSSRTRVALAGGIRELRLPALQLG